MHTVLFFCNKWFILCWKIYMCIWNCFILHILKFKIFWKKSRLPCSLGLQWIYRFSHRRTKLIYWMLRMCIWPECEQTCECSIVFSYDMLDCSKKINQLDEKPLKLWVFRELSISVWLHNKGMNYWYIILSFTWSWLLDIKIFEP